MDTTKNTHRVGSAAAILIGSAIALVPVTASASETAATLFVPNGPDIAISAVDNLRQAIEADRGTAASTLDGGTDRPASSADRGGSRRSGAELGARPPRGPASSARRSGSAVVLSPQPAPDRRDVTLRQLIEADG